MIQIREVGVGYDRLGYTIERLPDGYWFDGTKFVAVAEGAIPPEPIDLKRGTGNYASVFSADIPADPAIFLAGAYCVYIHRMDSQQAIAARPLDHNPAGFLLLGGVIGSR